MDVSEPSWELYRTFLEVLREGSLSAAARSLGLTQPTVGRHIETLEATLGVSLFIRTQRGFSPTDTALALRPYAETLSATSAALLRAVTNQGGRLKGTVRITASEVISVEVLPSILSGLAASYPDIVIELVPSNRLEDLLRRDSDIAVRMVRPSQEALVARHIGVIPLGLYAHRDYLHRRGLPESLDALKGHALIGFDRETAFTRAFTESLPWLKRACFSLRTDSDLAAMAALRASYGIGGCQVALAQRDPGLVRLFQDSLTFHLDMWLAMHEDLRDSPCCRVVFDALVTGLLEYVASTAPVGGERSGPFT